MTSKYPWDALKVQFIKGEWLNLSSFLKDQNIPNNSYTRSKTVGWLAYKKHQQQQIVKQTSEKMIEDEVEVIARQAKIAKAMQIKGVQKLAEMEVLDISEARKLIETGLTQEREILGLNDRKKNIPNLTQVNVNLPKTQFDEMIDKLSYEEMLLLIAEIKREKERRNQDKTTT